MGPVRSSSCGDSALREGKHMAASQGPLAQVAEGRERLKLFWAAEGVEFRDVWASLSQVRARGPKREGVGVGGGGGESVKRS